MARLRIILDTMLGLPELAPKLDQLGDSYTVEIEEFRPYPGNYGQRQKVVGKLDEQPLPVLARGASGSMILAPAPSPDQKAGESLADQYGRTFQSLRDADEKAKAYLRRHLTERSTIAGIRAALECNNIKPGEGLDFWPTTRLQTLVVAVRQERIEARHLEGMPTRKGRRALRRMQAEVAKPLPLAATPPTPNNRTMKILQIAREHVDLYSITASSKTGLWSLRNALHKAGIRLPKSGKWSDGTLIRYIRRVQAEKAKADREARVQAVVRELIGTRQPNRPLDDKKFLEALAQELKNNDLLPERGKPRWTFGQLRGLIVDATAGDRSV